MRKSRSSSLIISLCIFVSVMFFFTKPDGNAKAGASESDSDQEKAAGTQNKNWRDPLTGMEFVWVPGGCFTMGSSLSEQDRDSDEGPVHEVCVDAFWMGKYEVTRGEFQKFVNSDGYKTDAEEEGFSWVYTGRWERRQGYNWHEVGFDQDDRHPVVNVSWKDANAMADWLSRHSRGEFRLPTEAEWEYACRAGTTAVRYWGDNPDEACTYANVADRDTLTEFPAWTVHNCKDGFIYTAPVGTFKPNDFGLYDMLGNVWEWCEDVYNVRAYSEHSNKNPVYKADAPDRVIRGGSWYSRPEVVRCASRDNLHLPTRRGYDVGFRLVKIP